MVHGRPCLMRVGHWIWTIPVPIPQVDSVLCDKQTIWNNVKNKNKLWTIRSRLAAVISAPLPRRSFTTLVVQPPLHEKCRLCIVHWTVASFATFLNTAAHFLCPCTHLFFRSVDKASKLAIKTQKSWTILGESEYWSQFHSMLSARPYRWIQGRGGQTFWLADPNGL